MHARSLVWAASAALVACQTQPPTQGVQPPYDPSPGAQAQSAQVQSAQVQSDQDAQAQDAPTFTVQEWGLLLYGPNQARVATGRLAQAAPRPTPTRPTPTRPTPAQPTPLAPDAVDRPSPKRKPVIYLKPDGPWPAQTEVSVTITMKGSGKLREVWPTPGHGPQPAHGASFTWPKVLIQPSTCAAGWGAAADSPPCASLRDGDECEAAELESWVQRPERCLMVEGAQAGALLYNGSPHDLLAPLAVDDAGQWRNRSAHALDAALIIEGGQARVSSTSAPGAALTVDARQEAVDPLVWTRQALARQGLGPQELEDFMRAWSPMLRDVTRWRALGFLSPQAIEDLSTLSVTPKPRAVTRVMAFLVEAQPPQAQPPRASDSPASGQNKTCCGGDDPPKEVWSVMAMLGPPQLRRTDAADSATTQALVMRVTKPRQDAIKRCYTSTHEPLKPDASLRALTPGGDLAKSPQTLGRWTVSYTISPEGRPQDVSVTQRHSELHAIEACLLKTFGALRFPQRQGSVAVSQTITYAAQLSWR